MTTLFLPNQMRWFTNGMTLEEAERQWKRYARQYHPDIIKDNGATMAEINTEFQQYKEYLARPQPIPFQVGTNDPTAFWSAVVGSAKANAGTMDQQPTQAAARAAQAAAPATTARTSSRRSTATLSWRSRSRRTRTACGSTAASPSSGRSGMETAIWWWSTTSARATTGCRSAWTVR